MFRRHPLLIVVGAAYFGGLCFVALGPRSEGTATFASGVLLFLPIGPILIGLLGRSRWLTVLLLGLLASVWVQLACVVWRSDAQLSVTELASNALGVAAGTTLALAVALMVSGRERIQHSSFTRLSQTSGSGLTIQSPPD